MSKIDVSKCKYHNNGWCELPESKDDIRYKSCGDMTLFDCYYKQLQQLKAENEKLKELLEQLSADEHQQLLLELYKNRQKLEKIREKCEKYDANVGDTIIANPIQDLYDILQIIESEE